MAIMKSEQDGKHPSSHYILVGDSAKPTTWHLRYKDVSGKVVPRLLGDAHAALVGGGFRGNAYKGPDKQAAIARLRRIYKQEGIPWPGDNDGADDDKAKHSAGDDAEQVGTIAATFNLDSRSAAGDGYVRRCGKIFDIGVYFRDKQFELTLDEAMDAVADFVPVPVDSEHRESVFDGKLGDLESVAISDDGMALFGTVLVPTWLDDLFDGEPLPVSTTWSRGAKKLIGLALAKSPRVSDAAIMAAFSAAQGRDLEFAKKRHDTRTGRRALQHMHDVAVTYGATCSAPSGSAQMASRHESGAIQQMHDMAVSHGAVCESIGNSGDVPPLPWYSGKDETSGGARSRSKRKMDWKAFKSWFQAGDDAEPPAEFAQLFEDGEPKGGKAEKVARELRAEFATAQEAALRREEDLRKQLAEERAHRIATEAVAFADAQIRASKALPAEREAMVAAYTQATLDDGAHGAVAFGDGQTTSRVAQLKALYAARPSHGLTDEQLKTREGNDALFNKQETPQAGDEKPMSKERKLALLKMSTLGKQALPDVAGK